jgi:hypothetical protein
MNWYDTLLFLHVLSAFMVVTGVTMIWAMFAATGWGKSAGSPVLRIAPAGSAIWGIGSIGVLVFGIWLAIYLSNTKVWDGWVLIAIGLWFVAGFAGGQLVSGYRNLRAAQGAGPGWGMHVLETLAVLALLIDMIWKPGA